MEDKIAAINARLKAAKIGVAVCLRGDKLSLRATLPPRPGSDHTKPYQQYLALDVYANPAGLKPEAEVKYNIDIRVLKKLLQNLSSFCL